MDPLEKIDEILNGIDAGADNDSGAVYINSVKNEFVLFNGRIEIPRLPVKEIDPASAADILASIARYIPAYMAGRRLASGISAAHQHSLRLARRLEGNLVDFVHLFRIDLKYGGGAGEILERGGTDYYPSYATDRVYFKSRLVPVEKEAAPGTGFLPVRLVDSTYTDSDQYFHTFAIFEETGNREATMEIHRRLDMRDIFPVSTSLYPFVEFEHFTACLNVPDPTAPELERAKAVFEPLFLHIYSRYRPLHDRFPRDKIEESFPELCPSAGGGAPGDGLRARLAEYFGGYSFHRDDELALKGWWRIDIVR